MNLRPERYYPCLTPTEQAACRLAFASVVPPYVFVIPCAPIDDFYASSPVNFDLRQQWWEEMFHFHREEIEIIPDVFVEVYTDLYGFLSDWLLYPPINGGVDDTHCRQYEYD
jgi:hypothetical protein